MNIEQRLRRIEEKVSSNSKSRISENSLEDKYREEDDAYEAIPGEMNVDMFCKHVVKELKKQKFQVFEDDGMMNKDDSISWKITKYLPDGKLSLNILFFPYSEMSK